jgi:hypothetical protein
MAGIVLKPANRAAQLYVGGSDVQSTPRQQHQFVLVYNLYIDKDDFLGDRLSYLKEYRDRLHFLCNTFDAPKFTVQQDVINQYNRKRVVNRKVDYDPVTVRMYDTVDGLGMKFARTLYEYEFKNARLFKKNPKDKENDEKHNYVQSVLIDDERFRDTHHFGARGASIVHRLLKSIDFYQISGGTYSKTRIIHPRLARMDMDQFDFSSAQPVNINLAFQYENLVFEETNVPIREGDGGELIPGMMESTSTFEDFVPAAPKSEESPKITKKDEEPGSEPGGPNDTTSELSPFGPGDGGKPDIGQVTGPKTSDITNKIKAGATKVGSATKSVVKGLNFGL